MTSDLHQTRLMKIFCFQDLSTWFVKRLAALLRNRLHAPGGVVYGIGDVSYDVYLLLNGSADIMVDDELITTVQAGGVLNVEALNDEQYHVNQDKEAGEEERLGSVSGSLNRLKKKFDNRIDDKNEKKDEGSGMTKRQLAVSQLVGNMPVNFSPQQRHHHTLVASSCCDFCLLNRIEFYDLLAQYPTQAQIFADSMRKFNLQTDQRAQEAHRPTNRKTHRMSILLPRSHLPNLKARRGSIESISNDSNSQSRESLVTAHLDIKRSSKRTFKSFSYGSLPPRSLTEVTPNMRSKQTRTSNGRQNKTSNHAFLVPSAVPESSPSAGPGLDDERGGGAAIPSILPIPNVDNQKKREAMGVGVKKFGMGAGSGAAGVQGVQRGMAGRQGPGNLDHISEGTEASRLSTADSRSVDSHSVSSQHKPFRSESAPMASFSSDALISIHSDDEVSDADQEKGEGGKSGGGNYGSSGEGREAGDSGDVDKSGIDVSVCPPSPGGPLPLESVMEYNSVMSSFQNRQQQQGQEAHYSSDFDILSDQDSDEEEQGMSLARAAAGCAYLLCDDWVVHERSETRQKWDIVALLMVSSVRMTPAQSAL